MRVNIGYGCQLDEVLEEGAALVSRTSQKIGALATALQNVSVAMTSPEYDAEVALNDLHNARVVLARVDLRLEDVGSIITAYEEATARVEQGLPIQSGPPDIPVPEDPTERTPKRKARKKKVAKK